MEPESPEDGEILNSLRLLLGCLHAKVRGKIKTESYSLSNFEDGDALRVDIGEDGEMQTRAMGEDASGCVENFHESRLRESARQLLWQNMQMRSRRAATDRDRRYTPYTCLWANVVAPRMNLLILAVGTRGDIDPFIAIGIILKYQHNHRVTLATHECFRARVLEAGLLFFPLAGDPQALSKFMCSTQGKVFSPSRQLLSDYPRHLRMMREITRSCWDACVLPSEGKYKPPSTGTLASSEPIEGGPPDALIANPVCFAHVHIAEAMGVPLHLMFPQPWAPTSEFPHVLSGLPYEGNYTSILHDNDNEKDKDKSDEKDDNPNPPSTGGGHQHHSHFNLNRASHAFVDLATWVGLEGGINELRTNIGLKRTRGLAGEGHWNAVNSLSIPITHLFSPSLVTSPSDWPNHARIVGAVQANNRIPITPSNSIIIDSHPEFNSEVERSEVERSDTHTYTPKVDSLHDSSSPLDLFLANPSSNAQHQQPIFVGFGSMVTSSAELEALLEPLVEASAITSNRIIVQVGWSSVSPETFHRICQRAERLVIILAEMTLDIPIEEGGAPLHQWSAATDAFLLTTPCEHSWLFPRMRALVHHGGSGTTHAGLAAGKPTWICPFFGDQSFWGHVVWQRGLGPKPCPVADITLCVAEAALVALTADKTQSKAREVALKLGTEDGAQGAANSFLDQLPLHQQLCPLSLLLGETRLSQVSVTIVVRCCHAVRVE